MFPDEDTACCWFEAVMWPDGQRPCPHCGSTSTHEASHGNMKHLQRYVNEFAGRHNIRDLDTADQMARVVAAMVGQRLMYRDLVDGPRGYAT